jgi:hypothetical protein
MTMRPTARTREILDEAAKAAAEAGLTPAVVLALVIERLEVRIPRELRRVAPERRVPD